MGKFDKQCERLPFSWGIPGFFYKPLETGEVESLRLCIAKSTGYERGILLIEAQVD